MEKPLEIFPTESGYMLTKQLIISTLCLPIAMLVDAQSGFNKHVSWWPAYYLKYSINNKWALNTDIQARNFANEPLLGLFAVRSGVHYRISNQWSFAGGGAWFHQQQLNMVKQKIATDELRLWEEIKHEGKINKWQLINQFRTEQRHLINQDGVAFRFRYKLAGEYGISEKWKAMIGNELMWQSNKERKDWDQYRVWLGGEYAFNKMNQVQLFFMDWWQAVAQTHQLVVRINFIQSIN
jgi:hypothetical protein